MKIKNNSIILSSCLFALLAGFFSLYWIIYAVAPELHRTFVQGEDRLVEWLTFLFFVLAGVMSLFALRYREPKRGDLVYLIIMGLFFMVCAGEEISWGQRIFGLETPDVLLDINDQKEINIHNIAFEHIHPYGIMSWFVSMFGIILPLVLFKKISSSDSNLGKYLSPLILVPSFLFSLIIRSSDDYVQSLIVQYSGADTINSYVQQTAELQEMYWGVCLFMAMAFIYLRRRQLNARTP